MVEINQERKVTSKMKIYSEESFGPVKSIIRVNGVDETVRVASDTEYGFVGGKAVFNEFTDLRWITIEGPQHYPF
jgi:vanillin dehydrogenase